MARDPILFGGGRANLYAYVGNEPINFIDPSGLAWGFGISFELGIVGPFMSDGGGASGINIQYTSDGGWNVYSYTPVTDPKFKSEGFVCGGSILGNVAWGDGGEWSGNFYNVGGNLGPYAVGAFTGDPGSGPGLAWQGASFGVGGGAPVGGAATATNYVPWF